jgi:chromosome segregation protein
LPDVVAVTPHGDVLSAHFAAGRIISYAQHSSSCRLPLTTPSCACTEASHACDRLRFAQSQLDEQHRQASASVEITLARLHES